eukprot:c11418_g1_i1.p2 GENE.c11418_g1_i1~~c11418_g1_i1.p2  ORF type:complete len:157 (-),score=30.87 c11418_g1_i1:27-497(-)
MSFEDENHFVDLGAGASAPTVKKRSNKDSSVRMAATSSSGGGSRVYQGASVREVMSTIGSGRRAPEDEYVFMHEEEKPPVKAILMAVGMLLLGSVLITVGALLITGVISSFYWERGYSLIILGALPFIPGAYYSYIAYGAWQGYKEYSYSLIPDVQ